MSDYEFTITLRIRHPDIDPQASWKRGDLRVSPEGDPLQGARGESYWTGRLMPTPQLSSSSLALLGRLGLAVAREVHPHVPESRPRLSSA